MGGQEVEVKVQEVKEIKKPKKIKEIKEVKKEDKIEIIIHQSSKIISTSPVTNIIR